MHERELPVPKHQVGALLDSLSSVHDALWPIHTWPRMEFDRPLQADAVGGHGPIRYFVAGYSTASSIRFQFTKPAGFDGHHRYEIFEINEDLCVLRHTLEMEATGPAIVTWPVIYGPLHDALIEDSLALAQAVLGQPPWIRPWSPWVKFLRWLLSAGKARAQVTPDRTTGRKRP